MRLTIVTLLGLVLQQAGQAVAEVNYIDPVLYCVQGCDLALQQVSFKGASPKDMTGCSTPLFVDSLLLCTAKYCTARQANVGLAQFNETCMASGAALPSYDAFIASQGAQAVASVQEFSSEASASMPFDNAAIPDPAAYAIAHDSIAAPNYATYLNWVFSWAFYGYWALVILIGIVVRVVNAIRLRQTRPVATTVGESELPGAKQTAVTKAGRWVRRQLIIPLLYDDTRAPSSSPTRIEALLIVTYIAMIFAFCFPGYHLFAGNLMAPATSYQLGDYASKRFSSLALANFPLIWVFAVRNEVLMWVTGWSYASFSQFHRWIARTATLLVVAHAIGRTYLAVKSGRYISNWTYTFWFCGAISVVIMCLMVATASAPIRNKVYDLFLSIHVVLATCLLVAVYYHVQIQPDVYTAFLWPCVAIWALDRLLRLGRVAYFSLSPRAVGVKAKATFDEATGLIRVDVTNAPRLDQAPPGSHFFVYEPARLRGYESHPFTLCSWTAPATSSRSSLESPTTPTTTDLDEKIIPTTAARSSSSTSSGSPIDGTTTTVPKRASHHHTFLIKPRKGFTSRLHAKTLDKAAGTRDLTVFLEGPYGGSTSFRHYDDVLLLVGGSGITSAVSRAYDLLHQRECTTSVHLVWAVPHQDMARNVCAHELGGVLGHPRLRFDVFVTQEELAGSDGKDEKSLPYTAHYGRPQIAEIVGEDRVSGTGRFAVMVCGPSSMTAVTRSTVVRLLGESGRDIVFHEERFGW